MAISPKDLAKLNPEDFEAIAAFEGFVDGAEAFKQFNGMEVLVPIPAETWNACFGIRFSIRWPEFAKRYYELGWKTVSTTHTNANNGERKIKFSIYEPSSGSDMK